jgi:hypothetical protein
MKTIKEQWKTIKDFPEYEISNLGRCRIKRNSQKLKRIKYGTGYVGYILNVPKEEGVYRKRTILSPGMLVARHFVENPNGYKRIIYIDGDVSNAVFTNIQWSKRTYTCTTLERGLVHRKKIIPKEEQLKTLRLKIERAERFEKAILSGTEQNFIYGELKDEIQKKVNSKYNGKNYEFKENAVQYLLDFFSDCIHRGLSPITFDHWISMSLRSFHKEYKQQHQTVEFNERTM